MLLDFMLLFRQKTPTFEATHPTLFHIFRRVELVSCCPSTEEIMNNAQGYFGTAGIRVDLCNLCFMVKQHFRERASRILSL